MSRLAELADWPAPEPTVAEGPVAVEPAVVVEPEALVEDELTVARRRFARLVGGFRRSAVLVPLNGAGCLWSADQGGVRWICAFSDEEALARFARAQGDAGREWEFRTVLGARLLDVMVPMLPGPAGVALDAGDADGVLFPPVAGIVPDAVAVDVGEMQ